MARRSAPAGAYRRNFRRHSVDTTRHRRSGHYSARGRSDALCGRRAGATSAPVGALRGTRAQRHSVPTAVPCGALYNVYQQHAGPAGCRLADKPVAYSGRLRPMVGARVRAKYRKVFLPPRADRRLHIRRCGGRVRVSWFGRARALICRSRAARPAHRGAGARPVRRVTCGRAHRHHHRAIVYEHRFDAGAHTAIRPASYFCIARRHLARHSAGRSGRYTVCIAQNEKLI